MTVSKEQYGLLTDAEVALVERRMAESGISVDEAVATVKAERVGPASVNDDTPAANVPGGQVGPPSVNGPEARLAELYRQRDVLEAEITTVERDIEIRRNAYGGGVNPTPTPITASEFTKPPGDGTGDSGSASVLSPDSTDEDLAGSNAADLVAFVKAYPDQADRVGEIEEARETPRSTVIDAVVGARP